MSAILQKRLPHAPWMAERTSRLPGIQPAEPESWIVADEAFDLQMSERDRLIRDRIQDVHCVLPEAQEPAEEVLDLALVVLKNRPGYRVGAKSVERPDGATVPLERDEPLKTLGRLIQEDVCILQSSAKGHFLSGAILCFPASWTLSQKLGRSLEHIHGPVEEYSEDIARRVQRLHDAVRPGRPMWRSNALLYEDPSLFQPRREEAAPRMQASTVPRYVRSERQTLMRLAKSEAVVFTIHTYVVRIEDLTDTQRQEIRSLSAVSAD